MNIILFCHFIPIGIKYIFLSVYAGILKLESHVNVTRSGCRDTDFRMSHCLPRCTFSFHSWVKTYMTYIWPNGIFVHVNFCKYIAKWCKEHIADLVDMSSYTYRIFSSWKQLYLKYSLWDITAYNIKKWPITTSKII